MTTAPRPEAVLLNEICRCSQIDAALADPSHPCHAVVSAHPADITPRHTPEPWNGRLCSAPILMVSSNPSISGAEVFPDATWSDDQLVDFFDERFTEGLDRPAWIAGSNRTLQRTPNADGTPAYSEWVRFLSARNRATDILGSPARPGADYCLTEVVHCKSTGERGVEAAGAHCADRWLDRIIALSPAPVIVTFGVRARTQLQRLAATDLSAVMNGPVTLGGHDRWIVAMPHPNARGKKTGLLDRDEMDVLRGAIRDMRSTAPAGGT